MKKILTTILAGVAIVFAMTSCDKLKEPYFVEPIVVKSDTIALTADDTINFDGKKVVILEDYTGVKCNNCPAAAELAAQLQEQYEPHLIVMGVHPKGNLQLPTGGFPDFRTDIGNEWNNYFNIASYPNGTVNRQKAVGSPEWAGAVASELEDGFDDAYIRLIVKTRYDEATRELSITAHSKMLVDLPSELSLTTCIMEDSIKGKQVKPTGIDTAYMHRHVFRGTADGITWGGAISDDPSEITEEIITAGSNFIRTMKFTVDEAYNADQLYIVAFIARSDNHYVFQAAETKIK